jgi:hypothetical protein
VGLDRDSALLFQIHVVENLTLCLLLREGPGDRQQAIGERGLAVIDVGDDAEVADTLEVGHRFSAASASS